MRIFSGILGFWDFGNWELGIGNSPEWARVGRAVPASRKGGASRPGEPGRVALRRDPRWGGPSSARLGGSRSVATQGGAGRPRLARRARPTRRPSVNGSAMISLWFVRQQFCRARPSRTNGEQMLCTRQSAPQRRARYRDGRGKDRAKPPPFTSLWGWVERAGSPFY